MAFPKKDYRRGIKYNATSVIITHNHPGGLPEPSEPSFKSLFNYRTLQFSFLHCFTYSYFKDLHSLSVNMLSIALSLPSMLILMPLASSIFVKSLLVNCDPWSELNIWGLPMVSVLYNALGKGYGYFIKSSKIFRLRCYKAKVSEKAVPLM
mgnify:CR=1 FL=1